MVFVCHFVIAIDAQGPVATALFLGDPALFNTTREDCIWKRGNDRDQCPDPDVTMTLFPPKNNHAKSKVKSFFSLLNPFFFCITFLLVI